MVQMASRNEVAGPSSGMFVVGDVVRLARLLLVGAEARAALAVIRPGMVMWRSLCCRCCRKLQGVDGVYK